MKNKNPFVIQRRPKAERCAPPEHCPVCHLDQDILGVWQYCYHMGHWNAATAGETLFHADNADFAALHQSYGDFFFHAPLAGHA